MSSSSSDEGFGDFFGGEEAVPEYPIETLVVDRLALANEGTTNTGFTPLFDRFDHITPKSSVAEAEEQIAVLRERLAQLQPSPLQVRYRDKRHSLWGHRLWNAAKYLTKRMDERMIDVRGKTVLELGAGLGVPTLAAYKNGARVAVVTDYPDADLLDIIALNVSENCKPGDVDADVASEVSGAAPSRSAVEPLLWGKKEHIDHVMKTYTNGVGFDIVILSDILFNHVCNDDLADTLEVTLARNPTAAGYCVFSHHRAYKQLFDFEFFDKCVARGMQYELVDEQDYPMMFPEDRGPEEVRQPVKCYKITRRYDAGGPALDADQSKVDVVIQGTGPVQAYLAAALSRSGLKVLHCDGNPYYGGVTGATFSLKEFAQRIASSDMAGVASPVVVVDKHEALPAAECARFLIDVLPSSYMSNGDVIQQIVRSDMARTLEFQNLSGFLFIDADKKVVQVPLTRSDVFSTDAVGLNDKRRMMKFVKDVEASLAEQLHAKSASPADNAEQQREAAESAAQEAAAAFAKEAEGSPSLTLSELLTRKYSLDGRARDILTLMGMLDATTDVEGEAPSAGLLHSVQLVRQLLTSVGAYGGSTPFLVPSYGASELPQSMCRTAAVWGGSYVLRRSVCRIAVDEAKEVQYAVLSNGQHVAAKVIVAPEELVKYDGLPVRRCDDWQTTLALEKAREAGKLRACGLSASSTATATAESDVRFARVVVVARRPLLSWTDVKADADAATDSAPPVIMALSRTAGGHVVAITQHSYGSDQAPSSHPYVVLHFTASEADMSQEALQRHVDEQYLCGAAGSSRLCLSPEDDVIYCVNYIISSLQCATASQSAGLPVLDIPSETRFSHPYAIGEALKVQQATEQDRRLILHEDLDDKNAAKADLDLDAIAASHSSEHLCVLSVPTLRKNLLDDGKYMADAKAVYEQIVSRVGGKDKSFIFMERLPPVPQSDSTA